MKQCNSCLLFKELSEFKNHTETRDKKTNQCRVCINKRQRANRIKTKNISTLKYEKTIKGFLVRLYRNMKSRIDGVQKEKKHLYCGKELMSKEDFYEFSLKNDTFFELFKEYEQSGYLRKLAPSIDRIDSSKGYFVGNIEFVTMSENSRRSAGNRKKTKNIII